MTLADDFVVGALDTHMALYGKSGVIYEQPHTDPVTLRAIVKRSSADPSMQVDDTTVNHSRMIVIRTDPDHTDGGVADPAINDRVAIDGEYWIVAAEPMPGPATHTLRLERIAALQTAKAGYQK